MLFLFILFINFSHLLYASYLFLPSAYTAIVLEPNKFRLLSILAEYTFGIFSYKICFFSGLIGYPFGTKYLTILIFELILISYSFNLCSTIFLKSKDKSVSIQFNALNISLSPNLQLYSINFNLLSLVFIKLPYNIPM